MNILGLISQLIGIKTLRLTTSTKKPNTYCTMETSPFGEKREFFFFFFDNPSIERVDIENVSFFFFYMILPSPNQPNIVTNLVFFYYPRTYPQTNKVIQNSIQTIAIHFFLMDNLTCIWKAKY